MTTPEKIKKICEAMIKNDASKGNLIWANEFLNRGGNQKALDEVLNLGPSGFRFALFTWDLDSFKREADKQTWEAIRPTLIQILDNR